MPMRHVSRAAIVLDTLGNLLVTASILGGLAHYFGVI